MKLSHEHLLPVPQATAWRALNDIELLRESLPGCESIAPLGDDAYEVQIHSAIGPLKARFKGTLRLADLDPPNAYTLHFEGHAGPTGHARGQARVQLQSEGAESTRLRYEADASVGGKIAQLGSRLVDMAAQKMAQEFFDNFSARLRERYAPSPVAPAVVEEAPQLGLWLRLMGWLKRALGR